MKIDILTLFPEMFAPLEHSIVGKAREKGLLEIHYHNFRENAEKSQHPLTASIRLIINMSQIGRAHV